MHPQNADIKNENKHKYEPSNASMMAQNIFTQQLTSNTLPDMFKCLHGLTVCVLFSARCDSTNQLHIS